MMQFSYYEDKFQFINLGEDHSYPEYPFINSDIISSNYLKLNIPYSPTINRSVRDICPEIQNINNFGKILNEEEQVFEDETLSCINERYIISINEKRISSDFVFYFWSNQFIAIPTFYMLIPLEDIDNGKHVLSIEKKVLVENEKDSKEEELKAKALNIKNDEIKEWENETLQIIPFYLKIN